METKAFSVYEKEKNERYAMTDWKEKAGMNGDGRGKRQECQTDCGEPVRWIPVIPYTCADLSHTYVILSLGRWPQFGDHFSQTYYTKMMGCHCGKAVASILRAPPLSTHVLSLNPLPWGNQPPFVNSPVDSTTWHGIDALGIFLWKPTHTKEFGKQIPFHWGIEMTNN